MSTKPPYDSLYAHGFVRAATAVTSVKIGNVSANVHNTVELAREAAKRSVLLTVFPELGLTGYSNDDLFHQEALIDAAVTGLAELAHQSEQIETIMVVGLPLRVDAKLFNVAVVLYRGRILGATPKSYLPNYREFYEKRQFASGYDITGRMIRLAGQEVPFGIDLLYEVANVDDLCFHTEICEDIWVPSPPSTGAALAGATVLLNLSASNVTIGKSEYRHSMGADQSGRCIAAYLYTAAGYGESTTDLAWDGDAHIHENGRLLARSERFSLEPQLITADLHLRALVQDRMRMTSFIDNAQRSGAADRFRRVRFDAEMPSGNVALERDVPRFPYVPANPDRRDERCFEAYNIQVQGLVARLTQTSIKNMVIGISGGLDSTQALIVACNAADLVGIPRGNILSYTMPGFATSERTRTNAWALMRSLGVSAEEIDIRPSCMQMLRDIGHPYAEGKEVYDVTFENVQAGERTSHLFRIANHKGGFVVGTGDLSELALGWATYGVGDHMSHYAVNASVPKTLIQHLIRWVAESKRFGNETSEVLRQILDTEISPELVPAAQDKGTDQPAQLSEASIGPYELQDFHLYHVTRFGLAPSDVAYLAECAWRNREHGFWPPDVPIAKRNQYNRTEIVRWLSVFLRRFFGSTQFKRSCIPNAPKVGSGGSLSPRGDWRAPSDSYPDLWLDELEQNVPLE
ncbi:MAG: NAD(+) synthase [Spirochaetota bacterium]